MTLEILRLRLQRAAESGDFLAMAYYRQLISKKLLERCMSLRDLKDRYWRAVERSDYHTTKYLRAKIKEAESEIRR